MNLLRTVPYLMLALLVGCCKPYPAPRQIISTAPLRSSFTIERNNILPYSILVGLPPEVQNPRLVGLLHLKNSKGEDFKKSFKLDPAKNSSWLQSVNLSGYILAWTADDPQFLAFLKRGESYDINVQFDPPLKDATIWIMTLRGVGICIPTN